jgi:hypothetical protein
MLKLLESLIFILLLLSIKFGGNLSKFARAALPHLDTARHLSITPLYLVFTVCFFLGLYSVQIKLFLVQWIHILPRNLFGISNQ